MEPMDSRGLQSIYYHSMNHEQTLPEIKTEAAWKNVLQLLKLEQAQRGGLLYYDQEEKKQLKLSLISAPRDQAFQTGPTEFLVCLSMRSQHGDEYDMDFFQEGSTQETLRITHIQVHSVNGHARYQWPVTDGCLRQRPIS